MSIPIEDTDHSILICNKEEPAIPFIPRNRIDVTFHLYRLLMLIQASSHIIEY